MPMRIGIGDFPPSFLANASQCSGIEERLGHREVRAGFDLREEALDFVVEIVGDGIHRDADR
jgi:hypothetical protein